MRILIVEDEAEKRKSISACIYDAGVEEDAVYFASSVIEAKKCLTSNGFQLLILDINLPLRPDKSPQRDGGLEILRWLKGKGSLYCPTYIIGTTAYEDCLQLASDEFNSLIWSVVYYSNQGNSWRDRLASSVVSIQQQLIPPFVSDGKSYHEDWCIVTALESELAEIERVSNTWIEIFVRNDQSRYYRGNFEERGRRIDFVATCASDKGLSAAAIATTKAIDAFHPRYLAMTGICAGVKGKVSMGDIIVADPVWDWGSGKFIQKRNGEESFHPAAYQMRLDEGLRNKAQILKADSQWLEVAKCSFVGLVPDTPLNVHVGAVASGASVLQSSRAVKRVISTHKDLIGVEMEIFAVMNACHLSTLPQPKCIAIKSVCDFGLPGKNNKFQKYAANMSVLALREIMLLV